MSKGKRVKRPRVAALAFGLAVASMLPPGQLAAAAEVIDIGNRRELFVDDYLIERLGGGARLRLHEPVPREQVMVYDRSWEGATSIFHSIFRDGERFRMYYRGSDAVFRDGKLEERPHPYYYCYAESADGIAWQRPNVGIFEVNGSRENNVILATAKFDGVDFKLGDAATMFRDDNPAAKPAERYKALVRHLDRVDWRNVLMAFKSADGVRWSPLTPEAVLTGYPFDSQNLAFWDSARQEYRAYWRGSTPAPGTPRGKVRSIQTGVSKDFVHWEKKGEVTYVDSPPEEIYTSQIGPYFRAPHIFIGMPTRYVERPGSNYLTELPEREHREMRTRAMARTGYAMTEGLFMASRDGLKFKRWNEAFLRPGIEREGTWNYGQQYIAWHVVPTKSALEGAPDELSLYSSESYWTGSSSALRRYTLRMDGFVSVQAPMKGGELVTRPLRFTGRTLSLNFSTSAAGSVRVEIQDAAGKPHAGYSLADCPPVFGDSIDRRVHWGAGPDVSALAGKSVRLRFVIEDGDVYAFQFQD